MRTRPGRRARAEAGFTLIELLIVVAVIGMLSSIAIPALQNAMKKSRRSDAVSDLRVIRDALHQYAGDTGGYPAWGRLRSDDLEPLAPDYIERPGRVLSQFRGEQLALYVPFDVFRLDLEGLPALLKDETPQSFTVIAYSRYERDTRFYLTDSATYFWTREEGFVEAGQD